MRESLKRSIAHTPATGFEAYKKGSVVLCNACSKPILKLDENISLGDKLGRMARALKPLTVADLATLADREDIDAGIRAMCKGMTTDQRKAHVEKLREMRAGDPCMCPLCDGCFVQVVAIDKHEVMDKAYTVELLVVPPPGSEKMSPVRGKRISATGDWIN